MKMMNQWMNKIGLFLLYSGATVMIASVVYLFVITTIKAIDLNAVQYRQESMIGDINQ